LQKMAKKTTMMTKNLTMKMLREIFMEMKMTKMRTKSQMSLQQRGKRNEIPA
jgi:hypothetical protein